MQDWANYPRDNSFTHYSFISGEISWVLITIMAALVHGHFKVKRCTNKRADACSEKRRIQGHLIYYALTDNVKWVLILSLLVYKHYLQMAKPFQSKESYNWNEFFNSIKGR